MRSRREDVMFNEQNARARGVRQVDVCGRIDL